MTASPQCTRVHVQPAPGREVRMPERNFARMPEGGMEVQRSVYWSRRLAVGDVTLVTAPVADPHSKTTKGAKAP